jgi:putative membrane protein
MINFFKYLSITIKGICMGAADVIPGVSGGTIAFLMGIYQELVDSIKAIVPNFKYLLQGKISLFWKNINGVFLVSLISGILISVFSLARLMTYLLHYHPIELWSFFFGLILASSVYILKDIDKWNFKNIISLIIGIAIAAYICLVSPSETPDAYWFIFLSGAIAICAMILPGISGSFILLLMGKYKFIMSAVTELNLPVLLIFAAGAILGILLFSHFLSWLLKKYYMMTISLLSGFMIGSLIKVWPWKEVLSEGIDYPVLPNRFAEITGTSTQLTGALIFLIVGVIAVFVIEFFAVKKRK